MSHCDVMIDPVQDSRTLLCDYTGVALPSGRAAVHAVGAVDETLVARDYCTVGAGTTVRIAIKPIIVGVGVGTCWTGHNLNGSSEFVRDDK